MKSSISCAALLVALSAGTAQATGPIAPPPPYVPEIVPMPDPDPDEQCPFLHRSQGGACARRAVSGRHACVRATRLHLRP